MSAVSITHLAHISCPTVLRDLPGWLVWRYEPHANPGGKPRKVPYYVNGGRRAGTQGSPEDRQQLTSFDAARAAAARRKMDGVGFAPMNDFGIVALDFDNCVTDGQVHADLEPVISNTYAEYSPSGNGIRAFFKGNLGDLKAHGAPYGFETFSSKGYVTVTGNVLDVVELMGNGDQVSAIPPEVMQLVQGRFKREAAPLPAQESSVEPVGMSQAEIERCLAQLPNDLDYDQWVAVGMAVHHETAGEGFELWDSWGMNSPKYTNRDYGVERWNSFGKNGGKTVTMRSVLKMAGINPNGPASPEEFEVLVEEAAASPDKPLRYTFEPVHQFSSVTALPWVIKGVLPKAGLGVVYGASGSGKSFAVLDMSLAVARGIPWRGKRTKQGRVAYIAAEGADGFRKRLAAYALHQQVDLSLIPMTVLNAAPNLLEKKDASDVVAGIRASGGADLIIVDTFAQTTPGANENAGEDVGKALGHCKRIHELTGAMVVLIHHSGKDASKGARGWSGLRAAADAEIEVVREATGRYLRLSKSKDGEDGLEWGFDLEVVELGVDEDLDPITSCVVIECEVPIGGVPARKLGPLETVVNDVIQMIASTQTTGIELDGIVSESVARLPKPDGDDSRRSRVRRALNKMLKDDACAYFLEEDGTLSIG